MKTTYKINEVNYTKPAVYKIIVLGEIGNSQLVEQKWGLQVSCQIKPNNIIVNTLIGKIDDQSHLSGILEWLNDIRSTIVSVNILTEMETQ